MNAIVTTLAAYPILTLFVVIGLGYLLGNVKIVGFRLGVAGVLFAGLAVGALDPKIGIPEIVPSLGLIIFVYTLGIHSGPDFFASFRGQGWRNAIFVVIVLGAGALMTVPLSHAMNLSSPRRAGLYSGALTNAPALADARGRLRDEARQRQLSPEEYKEWSDGPVVAFSIAYPFGVIGVILCFQLLHKLWRIQPQPEDLGTEIRTGEFVVRNPQTAGRTMGEILSTSSERNWTVSRVHSEGETRLATPNHVLQEGDIVVVVGDEISFSEARDLFGPPSKTQLAMDRSVLDFRRVFVSSRKVVGKKICALNLEEKLGATITRLRRGDVDVVPTPETVLEYGDRVRIVTARDNVAAVSAFFGDSIKGTAETDFLSVAIGMVVGVLIGLLPIPLPGGTRIHLGLAGGPLLVALVLGKLERSGRITWRMPVSANLSLRQIGLLLFLAGMGTQAGYAFVQTLRQNGGELLLAGASITLFVTLLCMVVGHKVLKIPFDSAMGMMSAAQTQPACLVFASNLARSERPTVAYASIYPIAMVAKIILAQLLV